MTMKVVNWVQKTGEKWYYNSTMKAEKEKSQGA